MKPLIAIIGRPNVGKSTLFNRLSKGKKAITIDEPGATRDRNYADSSWEGKSFTVIDTGGFEPISTETILVQMREQAILAIEEADIILFLMDGKDGLTPSDEEIAKLLRQVPKPIFYIVNKIDGPKHDALAYEFYRLGIDKLYAVSAEHGRAVDDLMMDVVDKISPAEDVEAEEKRIRIAVVGRPNVGKSSLINKILGYERTIVNPLPGTTRDAIDTPFEYQDRKYLLIDTAGIRRKSRISMTLEKYTVVEAMKTLSRCDIALILIDAEDGVTDQDARIAGLAYEKGVASILVVNKWDLIEKDNATVGTYVKKIQDALKFLSFAPIIFVSAETGQRVTRIFDLIQEVHGQASRRIPTSELNDKIGAILAANPPSRHGNRPNKIFYFTQTSVRPPTFVFFVRQPKALHFSYERFLSNQIRETFGFDKVPLRLIFRKKNR